MVRHAVTAIYLLTPEPHWQKTTHTFSLLLFFALLFFPLLWWRRAQNILALGDGSHPYREQGCQQLVKEEKGKKIKVEDNGGWLWGLWRQGLETEP